ncbi:double zinc ribbon domain-containing protein [Myxococcota bacterium]|nr:double zinc ribbon domain-containing protein [Myxococcota bacterium]
MDRPTKQLLVSPNHPTQTTPQPVLSRDLNVPIHRSFQLLREIASGLRMCGEGLLALLYPPHCAGCAEPLVIDRSGDVLCACCKEGCWLLRDVAVCERCAAPMREGERLFHRWHRRDQSISWLEDEPSESHSAAWWDAANETRGCCVSCRGEGVGVERCRAFFAYAGTIRALLRRWKYQRDLDAGEGLCAIVQKESVVWSEALGQYDILVPVPMSRKRLRWRGFHPAWRLAQALGANSRCDGHPEILLRAQEEQTQVGLDGAARRTALAGQITLAPWAMQKLHNKRVLLVDDVITTGATLAACAEALRLGSPAKVDAMALCRAI